ncbi:unnamed protein product [Orchesella dallaii]|uniref:Lysosome-associated membrane glycoprotein 2-like luminal domain-containing protein n=1 Tax=Orchesella dallaii TaxID=48710 RepID=A0ABP1QRH6_9HEXA
MYTKNLFSALPTSSSPLIIFTIWVAFTSGIFLGTPTNFVQGASASDSPEDLLLKDELETTPLPTAPEYVVYENEYYPCVLVTMDASVVIEPKRTANKKITVNVPRNAEAVGDCGKGEDSKLILSWNSFRFTWHFQKSRVSDAWYIDYIELSYNTSDKAFDNDPKALPGAVQVIHSDDPLTLYLTPLTKSYMCNLPKVIKIFDDKKSARVTITLNRVQIQPFAAMTHRQYGSPFKCPEEAGRRDESVPFAVGMLLAAVVLSTIGGYAGYRYFRVKKIEYDTME